MATVKIRMQKTEQILNMICSMSNVYVCICRINSLYDFSSSHSPVFHLLSMCAPRCSIWQLVHIAHIFRDVHSCNVCMQYKVHEHTPSDNWNSYDIHFCWWRCLFTFIRSLSAQGDLYCISAFLLFRHFAQRLCCAQCYIRMLALLAFWANGLQWRWRWWFYKQIDYPLWTK